MLQSPGAIGDAVQEKPASGRRSHTEDDYQDSIALEIMVDWLEHIDRIAQHCHWYPFQIRPKDPFTGRIKIVAIGQGEHNTILPCFKIRI